MRKKATRLALDESGEVTGDGRGEALPALPEAAYAADAQPLGVRVRLKAPHTHAGVDYPAGAEIDVPMHTCDWLKQHNVIE